MALNVARIAKMAMDGAAKSITDAIHPATLTRTVQGTVYDPVTGRYPETTTTQTGRAVLDSVRPVADVFPSFVIGPKDQLVLLEGFTSARENDSLTFAGKTMIVRAAQDIVAAGTLFYIVAR